MAIRISGLSSGLDTEAIVQQLVSAYSYKKDNYVKAQTKLSWKQDAWSTLNKKIKTLYTSVNKMTYSKAYKMKSTFVSDASKATVTAKNTASNGTQTLKILHTAKSGYLTGGTIKDAESGASTLKSLGFDTTGAISVTAGGKTTSIEVSGETTVNEFVEKLNDAGVVASYDSTYNRIYVNSSGTGKANDFSITGNDAGGTDALTKLGLNVKSTAGDAAFQELAKYAQFDADGNFDAAATKAVMTDILSQLAAGKEGITSAENAITVSKGKIVGNDAQKAYAEAYAELNDRLKRSGADSTMSEKEKKDLNTLITAADVDKNYAVDADGNLIYENGVPKEVTGDDLLDPSISRVTGTEYLKDLEEKAGLVASKEEDETNKTTIAEYAKLAKTVVAYEADADNAARVTTVQEDYAANGDVSATLGALEQYNKNENEAIETANTAIKEAKAILKKYAEFDTGADADALTSRVGYAADVIKNGMTYSEGAKRLDGQDAVIELNGASYTSATNSFSINGLTIEALQETGDQEITVTTKTDTQGIYDNIKSFLKQYSALMNEMTSLYNAPSAKGYEPLTTEEKDSLTDTEVEEWEKKIKDSMFRRDDTLDGVMSIMKSAMSKSYMINGKSYSLASFGIRTQGFLNADTNEENAYHIDGDADDSATSENTDKLMSMINSDPDIVEKFMTELTSGLYDEMGKKLRGTQMKTYMNVYNDKQMAKEYSDYTETIKKWEKKITAMEDSYYKKFAAMESALAKLQSSTSSLSSLLGS